MGQIISLKIYFKIDFRDIMIYVSIFIIFEILKLPVSYVRISGQICFPIQLLSESV